MAHILRPLGTVLEHDTTQGQFNKSVKIDDTHVVNFWQGSGGDGFVRAFEFNHATGELTGLGTALEFDVADNLGIDAILFDGANHILAAWTGSGSDGFTRIFTVNTSTWAVTGESSALEYDTTQGLFPTLAPIDSTHALVCYQGTDGDGFAQVLTINTGTWAVTEPAAALEFETTDYAHGSVVQVDGTHFILFYQGVSGDGFVKILTVNTSTWAVTEESSSEHDTSNGTHNKAIQLDSTHYLLVYNGAGGAVSQAIVFEVNTGTWAVTEVSSALNFHSAGSFWNSPILLNETSTDYIVVIAWAGTADDGYMQAYTVNKSTWAIASDSNLVEFDVGNGQYNALVKLTSSRVVNFWAGVDADGFARAYEVNGTPTVALSSPADTSSSIDTTPTLEFTGTDPNADSVRYNVQIDTVNTFDSVADTATYNTDTEVGTPANVASLTGNVTIADNPNRMLIVGVTADVSGGLQQVLSITYAGVPLTLAKASGYGGNKHAEIWYLVEPPIGTASCVVTLNQAAYASAVAYDIHGVDQVDPFAGTSVSSQGTDDTPTVNITTDATNALIVDILSSDDGGTAGAGTTQYSADFTFNKTRSTTRQATSTGSYTQSYGTAAGNWALCAVALKNGTSPALSKVSGTDSGFTNEDASADLPRVIQSHVGVNEGSGTATPSYSFTFPTGYTNTGLLVHVSGYDNDGGQDGYRIPSGITYNGSAMTKLVDRAQGTPIFMSDSFWFLATPSTGSNTLAITFPGATDDHAVMFIPLEGVSATQADATANETDATTATPSISITTTVANALVIASSTNNGTPTLMNGGTNVARISPDNYNFGNYSAVFSRGVVAGTGSVAVPMNGENTTHVLLAVALTPASTDLDPFNSGDLASFTVQGGDALAVDTYYWRVKATDPYGSNIFGSWSITRSFEVTAGDITTTQTILGKAAILLTVLRTVLGRARITATTLQTVLGRARITRTTLQTITGLARITKSATQTIAGRAAILDTTLQTILGRARIALVTSQTIQGLARITATTLQTVAGRSRITASTLQTILGRAKITATTLQIVTGIATIVNTTLQTITGRARITASALQTILGRSRITAITLQTILGRGRITIVTSQTVQGLARITAATSRTIQGLARITQTTAQTVLGRARVQITSSQTVQGIARITLVTLQTIAGRARITNATLQTVLGRADILNTTIQTLLGRARITISSSQTVQGIARITLITSQTITGLARVTLITAQTVVGRSRILATISQTIQGHSRIETTVVYTILGVANILSGFTSTPQTIDGVSRITGTTSRTITGKASILSTVSASPPKFILVNGRVAYRVTNLYYIFV